MEFLNNYWGVNDEITVVEISLRALVMFFIALAMLRLSGMRPFGKGDAFDNIITILLGGVLSRGVVAATPFFSAVAGGIVIIVVHKILARLALSSKFVGDVVKGNSRLLYERESFIYENMRKADVTEKDIQEELRLKMNTSDIKTVDKIYIEKTGELSFIKKE